MAMIAERLANIKLVEYFPPERGWSLIERSLSSFDHKVTLSGTPIICIDRDFGYTVRGYDRNMVPPAPAWPGASDGVTPYMPGVSLDERENEATKRLEDIGLKAARHGDYLRGYEGCAFRRALLKGEFDGLPPITPEEMAVLISKVGAVHYTSLYRPDKKKEPEAFVLNDVDFTNVLPDRGRFYPIAIWLGRMLGIPYEKSLPMIEKTGELLLPIGSRRLYVVTS